MEDPLLDHSTSQDVRQHYGLVFGDDTKITASMLPLLLAILGGCSATMKHPCLLLFFWRSARRSTSDRYYPHPRPVSRNTRRPSHCESAIRQNRQRQSAVVIWLLVNSKSQSLGEVGGLVWLSYSSAEEKEGTVPRSRSFDVVREGASHDHDPRLSLQAVRILH